MVPSIYNWTRAKWNLKNLLATIINVHEGEYVSSTEVWQNQAISTRLLHQVKHVRTEGPNHYQMTVHVLSPHGEYWEVTKWSLGDKILKIEKICIESLLIHRDSWQGVEKGLQLIIHSFWMFPLVLPWMLFLLSNFTHGRLLPIVPSNVQTSFLPRRWGHSWRLSSGKWGTWWTRLSFVGGSLSYSWRLTTWRPRSPSEWSSWPST